MNIILKTGINGGSSTISLNPFNLQHLDLGVDGNIRVIYKNGDRSFPIQDIVKAPDWFHESYVDLMEVAEAGDV